MLQLICLFLTINFIFIKKILEGNYFQASGLILLQVFFLTLLGYVYWKNK